MKILRSPVQGKCMSTMSLQSELFLGPALSLGSQALGWEGNVEGVC